jgi:hypothetical protein
MTQNATALMEDVQSLSGDCRGTLDKMYFETHQGMNPSNHFMQVQGADNTGTPETTTSWTYTDSGISKSQYDDLYERYEYFMDRCKELSEQAGSVSEEEYDAAVTLVEALTAKCEEKDTECERLGERLKAATTLLEEIVKRNDRAQLIKVIREALDANPELITVKDELMKCESMEELIKILAVTTKLNEQGEEDSNDTDVPHDNDPEESEDDEDEEDKEEQFPSSDDNDDEEEPDGDDDEEEPEESDEESEDEEDDIPESMRSPALDIDLPDKGAKGKDILEKKKASGKQRKLDESTRDKSINLVHRVLNKRKWS